MPQRKAACRSVAFRLAARQLSTHSGQTPSHVSSPTMLGWLRKRFESASPLSRWSVNLNDGEILTSDGEGTHRNLPIHDLQKVVVATDDSGPWGADVMFLLYSNDTEPIGLFPLEAAGCNSFVKWLIRLPGYHDRELAKAMGSTKVAKFNIFEAEPDGS